MLEETLNKALDYTRGNNTYLQCVNNNIEHAALAVRNMESGLRGDIQDLRSDFQSAAIGMYNMGQGIRNDIQASTAMNINAIQGMAMGITSDIRASTYAVVASQNMLNQTFKQGFSSVNNTINLGLGLVGNKIDVLSKDISSKLYEIQDVLEHPRLTETRELYHRALGRYKKGFYEEALEDCLATLEIDKTDYISWYLLGLIYLFGAGENGNVINLDKAEEAFDNARKYIKPEMPKSNETKLMASEIFYHLGFTRLAKSNDYLIENKIEDSNTKLLEAQNATAQAYSLSKENLIAGYEYAKELHFLGKDSDSLKLLEELIRKEKNFAIKSVNDKNFESLWTDIEKLIERLKLEVCKPITKKLKETIDFYENKLKADDEIANHILYYKGQPNIEIFLYKSNELRRIYNDIESKDYFTVLSLNMQLKSDLEDFENFINTIIHDTKNEIKEKEEERRRLLYEECRRQEEERRRQEEEEHRKRVEKLKREEEERKREEELRHQEWLKECEAKEKIQKLEEEEKERRLFTKVTLISLFFIAIQWAIVFLAKRGINISLYYGIIPAVLGIVFSQIFSYKNGEKFGTRSGILWGVNAVLSFLLGYTLYGIINIISCVLLLFMSYDGNDRVWIYIASFFSIIFYINQFKLMDAHAFWGTVLFFLGSFCAVFSGPLGIVLGIISALVQFSTEHTILGIISCIVIWFAFINKDFLSE